VPPTRGMDGIESREEILRHRHESVRLPARSERRPSNQLTQEIRA
jgi:hypothetical protein